MNTVGSIGRNSQQKRLTKLSGTEARPFNRVYFTRTSAEFQRALMCLKKAPKTNDGFSFRGRRVPQSPDRP